MVLTLQAFLFVFKHIDNLRHTSQTRTHTLTHAHLLWIAWVYLKTNETTCRPPMASSLPGSGCPLVWGLNLQHPPHCCGVEVTGAELLLGRWSTGNRSKCGKCGPAPTRKRQWGARLAGRTHVHRQVFPWGIRPSLYLGRFKTCSC